MKHMLTALVQDRPGVLNRVLSLFRRHGLNIESLTVTRSRQEGVSQMTWVFDAPAAAPLVAQLEKLVEVLEVHTARSHDAPQDRPDTPTSSFVISQADGIV